MQEIGAKAVITGLGSYLASLDKMDRAAEEVGRTTERAGTAAARGFDSAGAAAQRATGIFGGLGGAVAALGGVFAAVSIAAFTKDAVMAASDMSESINKVNVVFGDSAGSIQEFASSAARNLGLSRAEALSTVGTFGNLLVSMGLSQSAAAGMSKDILKLGSDFASFNNIPVPEALEKIRAGLVGETEPLRSLGVNISAATVQAKAMQMGFREVNGELSASAKAQATWALILEQSKTAQGDFANTSTGMANSLKIIDASMKDAAATVGERLLPVIAPLVTNLAQALPGALDTAIKGFDLASQAVSALATGAGWDVLYHNLVQVFGPETAASIASVIDPIAVFRSEHLPKLVEAVRPVAEAVGTALPVAFGAATGAIVALVDTGASVAGFFQQNQLATDALGSALAALTAVQVARFVAALPAMIAQLAAVTAGLYAQATAAAAAGAATALAMLPFTAAAVVIGGLVFAGVQLIRHWDDVEAKAGEVADAVKSMVDRVRTEMGPVFDLLTAPFRNAWETIKPIIDLIRGAWGLVGDVIARAGDTGGAGGDDAGAGTRPRILSLRAGVELGEAITAGLAQGIQEGDAGIQVVFAESYAGQRAWAAKMASLWGDQSRTWMEKFRISTEMENARVIASWNEVTSAMQRAAAVELSLARAQMEAGAQRLLGKDLERLQKFVQTFAPERYAQAIAYAGGTSLITDVLGQIAATLPPTLQIGNVRLGNLLPRLGIPVRLPQFADGVMNFQGGLAVVGERGPEVVMLPPGASVLPNHSITNNYTVNASYAHEQSPASVRTDLEALIMLARR